MYMIFEVYIHTAIDRDVDLVTVTALSGEKKVVCSLRADRLAAASDEGFFLGGERRIKVVGSMSVTSASCSFFSDVSWFYFLSRNIF